MDIAFAPNNDGLAVKNIAAPCPEVWILRALGVFEVRQHNL
jgi:hypothetical protein